MLGNPFLIILQKGEKTNVFLLSAGYGGKEQVDKSINWMHNKSSDFACAKFVKPKMFRACEMNLG